MILIRFVGPPVDTPFAVIAGVPLAFKASVTDDLRHYAHAFTVPKDWEVKVVK